jgi:hypothetical protein
MEVVLEPEASSTLPQGLNLISEFAESTLPAPNSDNIPTTGGIQYSASARVSSDAGSDANFTLGLLLMLEFLGMSEMAFD